MIGTHDGHRALFPLGNPFRRIIQKGTSPSPKLLHLQKTFEEDLAERLENLNKNVHSDILSLSWMKCALASLSETHRAIQIFITDLQFPLSDWDEQWMDMYLDNSVKILDICNGFCSELAHLERARLLLQYILYILGHLNGCPSQEKLKKLRASLREWTGRNDSRNSKLNCVPSILQGLAESLCLPKVKNSAKGKVFMQVMYGVKVHTIFICSVLSAILSGSAEPLMVLPVSDVFAWAGVYNKLQTEVTTKLRRLLMPKKAMQLKELELVDQCAWRLASLTDRAAQAECMQPDGVVAGKIGCVEFQGTNSNDLLASLDELASELGRNAQGLANSVDVLSREVNDFFGVVLAGRDELLCNLRMPSEKQCSL